MDGAGAGAGAGPGAGGFEPSTGKKRLWRSTIVTHQPPSAIGSANAVHTPARLVLRGMPVGHSTVDNKLNKINGMSKLNSEIVSDA